MVIYPFVLIETVPSVPPSLPPLFRHPIIHAYPLHSRTTANRHQQTPSLTLYG
jgi:hypothetical protein